MQKPNTVDQIASESSESGTVAAVMPTPMANNANGVPEGERIADVSGRITANADEAPSVIEDLTRKILIKEIELEKFNLNYKLNSAKQGRWKGERYAMFNEINAGMGLTGTQVRLFSNP